MLDKVIDLVQDRPIGNLNPLNQNTEPMNVKIFLLLVAFGLTTLLPAAHSQSIMISSNNFSVSLGTAAIFTQAKFDFGVPGNYLFGGILFSNQNVGDIYTASSDSQDPNFSFTVNSLEHGTNSYFEGILASTGDGPLTTITDSQLFPGLNGKTLGQAGYQIQSFSLLIDSLSIQSPGSNPNGNGIWTDMSGEVTLTILAAPVVPEPAVISLFGIGSLLAIGVFRRGRRQWQI